MITGKKHFILPIVALLLMSLCWLSCGEEKAVDSGPTLGGYLDSAYQSKGYRVAMDSIREGSGISKEDFKSLQNFMRQFRDSIQGHPTYRELLERAQGLETMRKGGVEMRVKSMSLHHVQKLVEVRIVMAFKNISDKALGGFRAEVEWLSAEGKPVAVTPSFSVIGPISPKDSLADLRMEYALYKPTGNELNDPRNQARRDTLEAIEEIAKAKNLSAFRLRVLDTHLGNGLTPGQYWMRDKAEREKLDAQPAVKPEMVNLLKWADIHEDLVAQLSNHASDLTLMVSPVITERVEASHGKNLILDRIQKVKDFFHVQKSVNYSKMVSDVSGKRLVRSDYVDYWNWPMEIRVYTF
ncbi:MAG: hypothetical protein U0176_03940 [Bacteroidia bacterium]